MSKSWQRNAVAFRIEPVMLSVISPDQTGFIKGRHSFTDVCSLLSVIHSDTLGDSTEVAVSLDAEKAFDRVK